MLRLITTKRLRQVEQIENIHDLRFARDAINDAIEVIELTIKELTLSHGTPASDYQHIPEADVRDEIDHLRRVRINLRICQWRMGGSPLPLREATQVDECITGTSAGGTA